MFKLKPCQCGSTDVVCKKVFRNEYVVSCNDCSMRTGNYGSKNSAIGAWNYRPRENALVIELKAARAAIKELQQ